MEEAKVMNYKQTLEYIDSLQGYGSVLGLENIKNLCEKLGNPQNDLKFIHIAGTNGKGSVLCLTSTVLAKAGYKTGRYVSPTIFEYRERIQINGRMISQKDLCSYMTRLKDACDELTTEGKPHPTPFEIETAMSFLYFKEKGVDLVVLETGMGGNTDATNIVEQTLIAVFVSISMDHMSFLGKTLEEIARAKCGIIKEGCKVVTGAQDEKVLEVLKEKSREMRAELIQTEPDMLSHVKSTLLKQRFDYKEYKGLEITLPGRYQLDNAMLAVTILEELKKHGYRIPEAAIRKGFLESKWPGRFEILKKKPLFLADGAHNRDGAKRLSESIQFYFTNRRIIYIIGILRDKEQEEILKATCPFAEQILTVPTRGVRGLSSYELAGIVQEFHKKVTAVDSVEEAVELSLLMADKDTVIIAFGSLSYLGELIRVVKNTEKDKK